MKRSMTMMVSLVFCLAAKSGADIHTFFGLDTCPNLGPAAGAAIGEKVGVINAAGSAGAPGGVFCSTDVTTIAIDTKSNDVFAADVVAQAGEAVGGSVAGETFGALSVSTRRRPTQRR